MPFTNEVIGTNGVLIRNWLQSSNYIAGVSGWQITKAGSAEFNNGTFRGSIEVGSLDEQHFIVNNPATGDVVDIYDNTNTLVTKIDKFGEIISTNGTDSALMFGNGFNFVDFAAPPGSYGGMSGHSRSTSSQVVIDSGRISGGSSSTIFFTDNVLGPGGQPTLIAEQRGLGQGALVQTDTYSASNNYQHEEIYTVTTDASGNANFAHHCNFTPNMGWLTCEFLAGGVGFYQTAWFTNPFTSTNANAHFNDNLGANVANKTIRVYGRFVG